MWIAEWFLLCAFPGLALLLPHCPQVDFVEYVPSTRLNGRCHYYSKEVCSKINLLSRLSWSPDFLHSQMNSACTFGSWHPLAAEKLMALDMNMAEDDDMSVFQFGILRIRRPDKLLCGFNFFGYWRGARFPVASSQFAGGSGSDNPGAFNQVVFIECNKQFNFAMNTSWSTLGRVERGRRKRRRSQGPKWIPCLLIASLGWLEQSRPEQSRTQIMTVLMEPCFSLPLNAITVCLHGRPECNKYKYYDCYSGPKDLGVGV